MTIDLHVHSTASDGRTPPADVVAEAAAAGVTPFALTDHDPTAGWAAAADAARRAGVRLVPGVEISCDVRGIGVHLLGYLLDPDDPALLALWERTRASRQGRARRIVERMSADLPVTWDAVLAQAPDGATLGRPHIADALVAAGVARDRDEVFATLLHRTSPYYEPYWAPPADDVVRAVVAAGGVAVVAHPLAGRRGRTIGDDDLAALAGAGMAGLEAEHRDHRPDEVAHLHAVAADLGLLVTGSSDYHGSGKPNRLGENGTRPEVLDEIVARGRADLVVA